MAESEGNEPEAVSDSGEVEIEAARLEEKHSSQSQSFLNDGDASGLEESVGVDGSEVKGAGEGEGVSRFVERIEELQVRMLRGWLRERALFTLYLRML